MDITTRRDQLITANNPNKTIDYIITLACSIPKSKVEVTLRYIPDKIVLASDCFEGYVTAVVQGHGTLEESATIILDDLNNELVPRWLQVTAYKAQGNSAKHSIALEDHQPQWSNPSLLARLKPI